MGKCHGGVFANWTKKVGNVVGRIVDGVNVYSIYQPNVSNPNTQLQQRVRSNFSLLTEMLAKTANFGKQGMLNYRTKGTWLSTLIGLNYATGITGTYPNNTIDFSKLILSKGILDNALNLAAQVQGNDVNFAWTDNSGMGNASENDKFALLIYNKDKNVAIYDTAATDRSSRQTTYSTPTAWTGDSIEVYGYFYSPEKRIVSTSQYLGTFNL